MKNLRVNHAVAGPFRGQQVVPVSAFKDAAEVNRLVSLGVLSWTDDDLTPGVTPAEARPPHADGPFASASATGYDSFAGPK